MRLVYRPCVGLVDLALGMQILTSNLGFVDHALCCKLFVVFADHAVGLKFLRWFCRSCDRCVDFALGL